MSKELVRGPNGIYVPLEFAETARRPRGPDMQAVATTLDGRDITRGFVSPQILLRSQDSILLGRGGGDLRIYEDLLRDSQVGSTFETRRNAVTSKEWYVEAGGKRAIDKKAADSLQSILQGIEFDSVTDKMSYGRFYGYSVGELLYARDGREVVLDQIRVRKARRFRFDGAMRLRMLTTAAGEGELMPDRKFWVFYTGADNDDAPYGLGLGHYLYWPVLFKRNDLRFWLIFLEKFGMPTATGTYQPGANAEEKQRLLQALSAITTDSGVIVPEGMAIELLEAARSGTADYEALLSKMDDAISKVVLGHTAAADATPGRLGGESMAEEVRGDLVKSDADRLCESFNRGPAQWLTDWNYPGAAYPKVWRRTEEPTDWLNMSSAVANLSKAGYRPTMEKMEEMFGCEFEDIRQAPAPSLASAASGDIAPPNFSEVAPDENALATVQSSVDRWLEQIRGIVEEAASLPDLSRRLVAEFSELDASDFAAVMSHALTLANLQGRSDADDEAS